MKPKLTKAKEGKVEWISREVFALTDAWTPHYHRLKGSSNKEKKKIWDKIVETLEESLRKQGIELNKNASQIKKKRRKTWNTLTKPQATKWTKRVKKAAID